MARKKRLMSQDEINYRRMAKQANQRALRLERYLQDAPEAPTAGLDLYRFYLRQDYGETRQRFPEDPAKLSAEQLQVYSVQLSNFLSADLSRVSAVKKYEKLYRKYKEIARMKASEKKEPKTESEKKEQARIDGIEKKVLKGKQISNPKEFFDAVNAMYHFKFQKIMGYRDVMRIVSSVQNRSQKDVMTEIANIAGEMAQNRKVTYREITLRLQAIKNQEVPNDKKNTTRRRRN